DFEQENFLENFAQGNMRYRIAADEFDDDVEMYREESRSITEQRLAFTPAQAVALRDFLFWNARPENAFYRYDYYLANCSTRVRD
ncbi:lipoprotein N-acyltransferase Lnb domain-containing protein, partial [Ciceribacter ferrooxidans]